MHLTREEMLLITIVLQRPESIWRNLLPGCGMAAASAQRARDSLLKAKILGTYTVDTFDMSNRRVVQTRYRVIADMPFVHVVSAWIASGQQTPWPGPPSPRPRAVLPPQATPPPGIHRDRHERLLETILRNPTARWSSIRAASGLRSKEALEARTYLADLGATFHDAKYSYRRDGQRYMHFAVCINENHPTVLEMRKRLGLKKPEPLDQEILRARDLIRGTPAREGSPWRVEDVDSDPGLHATQRVKRES